MKTGVIAGNFDVIHPGYIHMFKECQRKCDQLIILLHADPTIERPIKLKPVLSVHDRREMLTYVVNNCLVFCLRHHCDKHRMACSLPCEI